MWSTSVIAELCEAAAEKARTEGLEPYVPSSLDEISNYPPFPFPNLGYYEPEGWEQVENWLVDRTGVGRESEPALTLRALKELVKERHAEDTGWAIIQVGQCQLLIAQFKRAD